MKKYIFAILAVIILFNILPLHVSAAGPFSDVPDNAWYKPYVDKLYERGITNGYADGTFRPNDTISVAEFITFTLRAMGYNNLKGRQRWYDEYVDKARELEVIGKSSYWSYEYLEAEITREQMAEIIVNAMREEDIPDDLLLYKWMIKDFDDINIFYQNDVLICYAKGLINGTPEGYFNPKMTATRAEAAKIIINLIEPENRQVPPEPVDPEAIVVEDSSVTLNVDFEKAIDNALICIEKGDQYGEFLYKVNSDKFNGKVYLPYGSGKYKVKVLVPIGSITQRTVYGKHCEYTIINKDTRDMSYLLPSGSVESDSEEIIRLAEEITKNAKDDMERIKLIHKWVATNIAYDTEAYFSGDIREYSAIETLNRKKAVCNGYARLTAALCRAVGIRTKIITGVAIYADMGQNWKDVNTEVPNHAWNEAFVDGRWVVMDTTWDAGYIDLHTGNFEFRYSTRYFDPGEESFAADHLKLSESEE